MDGINPTLAFAALFLGMSGNAQRAANDQSIDLGMASDIGCPAIVIAADPAYPQHIESWTETLQNSLADASALPGMAIPTLEEPALADTDGSAPIVAPVATADQSDPIMRRTVSAATDGFADDDPCAPRR